MPEPDGGGDVADADFARAAEDVGIDGGLDESAEGGLIGAGDQAPTRAVELADAA